MKIQRTGFRSSSEIQNPFPSTNPQGLNAPNAMLTTKDKVQIGVVGLAGGGLGAIPWFGAGTNLLSAMSDTSSTDMSKLVSGLGVASNLVGCFAMGIAPKVEFAAFALSGILGSVAWGSVAHEHLTT